MFIFLCVAFFRPQLLILHDMNVQKQFMNLKEAIIYYWCQPFNFLYLDHQMPAFHI